MPYTSAAASNVSVSHTSTCFATYTASVGVTNAIAAAMKPTRPIVTPLLDAGFKLEWGRPSVPAVVVSGETFAAAVIVKNAGTEVWLDPRSSGGTGAGAVRLGYRWWKIGDIFYDDPPDNWGVESTGGQAHLITKIKDYDEIYFLNTFVLA